MGETIRTTDIPRESGYLYYTGTDKEGNLTICKAKMGGGKRGKGKKKDE